MRSYSLVGVLLAATLAACGGGAGSAVGNVAPPVSHTSIVVSPTATPAVYTLSPNSSVKSPLTIVAGHTTAVTVTPGISLSGSGSYSVTTSAASCATGSLQISSSQGTKININAAAGAISGCNATIVLTINGTALRTYVTLQ